ncbi:hypothetical protein TRICI_001112 [Trichomonascus ciferrii]|uniref:Uncharacterized protein n=1 Tax=Trichomonascus ciferrii TaxID=44093 RepID=A0A642VBJ8_9ASCO|nr:hypothetical protein TRICI_001112 [Trichomonascus ciferrii]
MDGPFKKPVKRKRKASVALESASQKRQCNERGGSEMRHDADKEASLRRWFEVYTKTVKRLGLRSYNAYNVAVKKYVFNGDRSHLFVVECCNYEGAVFKPFIVGKGLVRTPDFAFWRRDVRFEEQHWLDWLENVFLPTTNERTKGQMLPSMIAAEYQPKMGQRFMKRTRDNRIHVLLSSSDTREMVFPLEAKFYRVLETHLYDASYSSITTAEQFWIKYKAARAIAQKHIQEGWHRSGFCPIRVENAVHLNKLGYRPPFTLEYDKGIYSQELTTLSGSLYNSRCKSPLKPSENI